MFHDKLSLFILYCRMQSLLTVDNSDSPSDDVCDCIGERSSAPSRETRSQNKVSQRSSLYNLLKIEDVSTTAVYFYMEL